MSQVWRALRVGILLPPATNDRLHRHIDLDIGPIADNVRVIGKHIFSAEINTFKVSGLRDGNVFIDSRLGTQCFSSMHWDDIKSITVMYGDCRILIFSVTECVQRSYGFDKMKSHFLQLKGHGIARSPHSDIDDIETSAREESETLMRCHTHGWHWSDIGKTFRCPNPDCNARLREHMGVCVFCLSVLVASPPGGSSKSFRNPDVDEPSLVRHPVHTQTTSERPSCLREPSSQNPVDLAARVSSCGVNVGLSPPVLAAAPASKLSRERDAARRVRAYGTHHTLSDEAQLAKRIKKIRRQHSLWVQTSPEAEKRRHDIARKGGIAFDQRPVCQSWVPVSPLQLMPDTPVWLATDYQPPTLDCPFPSTGTPQSDAERRALMAFSRLRSQGVDIMKWYADRESAKR